MNPSAPLSPAPLAHVAALGWTPLLPVWLLAAIGILCALTLALAFIRRASGTPWRLLASALLLLWLSGPHLVRASWQDLPETALLVVDQTASMKVGQRGEVAARAASALRAAAQHLGGIALRTVVVPPGSSGGTRLFDAIAHATSDIPAGQLAGILAVTDGEVHDVPATLPDRLAGSPRGRGAAQRAGISEGGAVVPFQALITAAGEQTDRRLRILQAPPYAIIGHDATMRVEVEDLGPQGGEPPDAASRGAAPAAGRHATLRLRRDGEPAIMREVPVGVPQDITLPISHSGPTLIELEAQTLPGEVSTLNNRAVVQINGVRDRLRVLLVSGAPNQGERVWRRLLKADPAVDLVHFTILRPPDKDDTTPLNELALIAFPTRELFQEKIDSFDLIILDGFENRGILPLAYLQNIADFVRGGGGLLLTAGPEFIGRSSLQDTPLGDILPVHVPAEGGLVEQRFQPMPTTLGRRHPVTADLPQMPPDTTGTDQAVDRAPHAEVGWGPWFRALRSDQSHGQVLLTAPDGHGATSPLLVLDHVDRGRTAMLLSDQIWLWSRGEAGGGPQAELLRRIAHWLMKEPELEEEQLRAGIEHGQLTVTRRSVDESRSSRVSVIAPDGAKSALTLLANPEHGLAGTLSGNLAAVAPGIWDITDGTRHAYAAGQPEDPEEIADLRATATRLAPIVEQSGGAATWLGDDPASIRVPQLRLVAAGAPATGNGWIGLRRTGAHVVTGTDTQVLLPAWLVLPTALLLLCIGWWREGQR